MDIALNAIDMTTFTETSLISRRLSKESTGGADNVAISMEMCLVKSRTNGIPGIGVRSPRMGRHRAHAINRGTIQGDRKRSRVVDKAINGPKHQRRDGGIRRLDGRAGERGEKGRAEINQVRALVRVCVSTHRIEPHGGGKLQLVRAEVNPRVNLPRLEERGT